jgi:Ca-activated chloride channel homolog
VKTVLARVRVSANANVSALDVAEVSVKYRDLAKDAKGADFTSKGVLSTKTAARQSDPDPFVIARVERSATARALDEANRLFREGKLEDARTKLNTRLETLKRRSEPILKSPSDPFFGARSGDAKRDVDKQLFILDRAQSGFATPPPPKPSPSPVAGSPPVVAPSNPFESNVRQNQEDAFQSNR